MVQNEGSATDSQQTDTITDSQQTDTINEKIVKTDEVKSDETEVDETDIQEEEDDDTEVKDGGDRVTGTQIDPTDNGTHTVEEAAEHKVVSTEQELKAKQEGNEKVEITGTEQKQQADSSVDDKKIEAGGPDVIEADDSEGLDYMDYTEEKEDESAEGEEEGDEEEGGGDDDEEEDGTTVKDSGKTDVNMEEGHTDTQTEEPKLSVENTEPTENTEMKDAESVAEKKSDEGGSGGSLLGNMFNGKICFSNTLYI